MVATSQDGPCSYFIRISVGVYSCLRLLKIGSTTWRWFLIDNGRILVHLVNCYGAEKWSRIAQMLGFRTGKQCRERWYNQLRPGIKKGPWSDEEDRVLIRAHSELGTKWSEIAKLLPGRTENSIKNRWYANKRKFPRSTNNGRRGRYPKSGSGLLQNYMQSLAQCSPAPAIPKKKKTNHNRPSAAVENVHMPEMYDVVQQFQQLSFDSGASSSNSNSGIDVWITASSFELCSSWEMGGVKILEINASIIMFLLVLSLVCLCVSSVVSAKTLLSESFCVPAWFLMLIIVRLGSICVG